MPSVAPSSPMHTPEVHPERSPCINSMPARLAAEGSKAPRGVSRTGTTQRLIGHTFECEGFRNDAEFTGASGTSSSGATWRSTWGWRIAATTATSATTTRTCRPPSARPGRPQRCSDLDHLVVIEVEARHRAVEPQHPRFLFQRDHAPLRVDLRPAVALRVLSAVAEDHGALPEPSCSLDHLDEAAAVEDVAAQDQETLEPRMRSCAMVNACARPSGACCRAQENDTPHCEQSPRSLAKRGRSAGVELTSGSRISPASA